MRPRRDGVARRRVVAVLRQETGDTVGRILLDLELDNDIEPKEPALPLGVVAQKAYPVLSN